MNVQFFFSSMLEVFLCLYVNLLDFGQLDRKRKPDQKLKTSPSIASFKERSKGDLLGSYEVCRVRPCLSCAVSAPAVAGLL